MIIDFSPNANAPSLPFLWNPVWVAYVSPAAELLGLPTLIPVGIDPSTMKVAADRATLAVAADPPTFSVSKSI